MINIVIIGLLLFVLFVVILSLGYWTRIKNKWSNWSYIKRENKRIKLEKMKDSNFDEMIGGKE